MNKKRKNKCYLPVSLRISILFFFTGGFGVIGVAQPSIAKIEDPAQIVSPSKVSTISKEQPHWAVWGWAHKDLGGRGELVPVEMIGFSDGFFRNEVAIVRGPKGEPAKIAFRKDLATGQIEVNPERDQKLARLIDAFLLVNQAYTYFKKELAFEIPTDKLPIAIEVDSSEIGCGAEASADGRNISFGSAHAQCYSGVEPTAVFHEFAHLVGNWIGWGSDNELSEGLADMTANFIRGKPEIVNFFKNQKALLRTADNEVKYNAKKANSPESIIYYKQAQAWSGFAWHAREALIAKYGTELGARKAEELFFAPLRNGERTMQGAVEYVFYNHSPDGISAHGEEFQILKEAAERHGFKVPLP